MWTCAVKLNQQPLCLNWTLRGKKTNTSHYYYFSFHFLFISPYLWVVIYVLNKNHWIEYNTTQIMWYCAALRRYCWKGWNNFKFFWSKITAMWFTLRMKGVVVVSVQEKIHQSFLTCVLILFSRTWTIAYIWRGKWKHWGHFYSQQHHRQGLRWASPCENCRWPLRNSRRPPGYV